MHLFSDELWKQRLPKGSRESKSLIMVILTQTGNPWVVVGPVVDASVLSVVLSVMTSQVIGLHVPTCFFKRYSSILNCTLYLDLSIVAPM
jgi:hypothetical protein